MGVLIQTYADAEDKNGEIVNALNLQGDPGFNNVANGDYSFNVSSPAFGSGELVVAAAGSTVSDVYTNTDVTFSDTSGNNNEDKRSDSNIFPAISETTTIARTAALAATAYVVSPSVGAYEVQYSANSGIVAGGRQQAAELAEIEDSEVITTTLNPNGTVTLIIYADDTDDSEEGVVEVEFELAESPRYVDAEGAITTEETEEVEVDEVQNIDNSDRLNTFTPATYPDFSGDVVATVYTNSGTRITNTRIEKQASDCPRKVDLIGVDYNLNTLICISEQYTRNVRNVPFGLGVGWGQGPPSIRMRGKNVYRVLNNSPSTNYVK